MKTYNKLTALILLVILLAPFLTNTIAIGESLNISFDKNAYDLNDTVTIQVDLNGYSLPVELALEVRAPNGGLVWIDEENVTASPVWLQFKLPGTGAPQGSYILYAAVEDGSPQQFAFLVRKPTFQIVSKSLSRVSVSPGDLVTLKAKVKNLGAQGPFELRLYRGASMVASSPQIVLGYMQSTTVELSFAAPPVVGNHYYRLEAYNVKYGVSDYNTTFFISVSTTTTVPPPPPPPPTSPTTTTTTATTTTATPTTTAGGAPQFVANFTTNVGKDNTTKTDVVVVNPQYNAKLVIRKGTKITTPPGQKPGVITMSPVKQPPPHPGAVILGTPLDFGPRDTTFDPPIIVEMRFNPSLVPQGYTVQLAYYDENSGKWVPVNTVSVDMVNGIVRGEISHFTIVAPLAISVITVVSPTTTTVTKTVQYTSTSTLTTTATQPPKTVTVTATQVTSTPVTVSTTVTKTTTLHTTATVSTTTVKTATVTQTVTKTPAWSIAAIVLLVVILAAALAFRRK